VIVSLRVFRERVQSILPLRGIILVVGIASIGYGQSLMEQRYGGGVPLPQAEMWNAIYRLQIVNFDFVLHALPYLFGGAFLCALTVLPRAWTAPFANWGSNLPSGEEVQWRNQVRRVLIGGALFVLLLIQLARHRYAWIYPILWLVSIYAFTHITWRWDRNAQKDLSPGFTALDIFWMAILLILGFGINTFALQDIPTIMIADEGSFWETARAIAIKDLHPAFFDSGVYTFPVASSIYQGWILRIFGLNIWAWRFSSVIAGVITVIPLYLLGREWFGRHAAIAAAVMMVSNPYFIAFARLGYNNSQSLFPVTLCIYFFALAARKGSVFYLWLAGLFAGIGFYTYFAAWIGLVVLCLGILYLLIMKQVNWRQAWSHWESSCWPGESLRRIAHASGENVDGLPVRS
jgi:hypothetical protein